MYLFLLHSLILLGASFGAARHLAVRSIDRFLAAGLLAWGNLVVTCLLLAGLHRLGDPAWFFRTSLSLAAVTWWLLRRLVPPAPGPAETGDDKFSGRLLAGFFLTLVPLAYASIRIAGTYEPNNYDSLAYHLPRAMFYMGQNTLAHFSTGNDRQIYFPFNYNLLQLFGLIYNPPLQTLNFFNLAAWAAAGVAIYRLGRLGGCSANAALIAAWVALTSTQILAQATATTNDLPTGAGLLCALVFALRWRQSRLTRDALLAGLAAGLTAGSKLTVIFFGPAAGVIVLVLAWQHGRRSETRVFFRGVRAWLVPGVLAFLLAAPFALINLAEKGHWMNKTYDFTLNRPFTFACAAQTAQAYLVQLFLEPLHRFTFNLNVTAWLNEWGEHVFFPHWNGAYAFSPFYLFPPDLNEDHVWFGFAGPFILLCAAFCLLRFRKSPAPVVWLGWLGLGWFGTYFLLNKWSLYNQRYFVLPILVMSPCVAALVQAGWTSAFFRRMTRDLLVVLALTSVWLAGNYLLKNTSRPYAPLWAGDPAPPVLPALPPFMGLRLAEQPKVNIHSTDGNERVFLFMTQGHQQRFIAFDAVVPDAYNVFSEWGFPRKVAYSNIEQLSSYAVVEIPTKKTAGVEFLGTIGRGQPALDYYGLAAHAGQMRSAPGNRNVLAEFYYAPREPSRYSNMRVKVIGLNPEDEARVTVGIEYEDRTTATLATFTQTGAAPVPVTKPFRRLTIRVDDQVSGAKIGAVDLPYLVRTLPPEVEAPDDPSLLFADELVIPAPPSHLLTEGLAVPEGPYPQWNLPVIRWAKSPVVRLEIPAMDQLARLELVFSVRLQTRDTAHLDVVLNGQLVQDHQLDGSQSWSDQTVKLTPQPGKNVLEFRNVSVGTEPDWLEYLERYPDVKAYVVSQKIPLEKGAREHYETFGKKEHRVLNLQRRTESLPGSTQLYYLFRSLRLNGFRQP
ncbi:MAG: glycosyltransferase family 39 protein [Lacunisphaera sp.]|nr:glycosyltransferase family 39 protein [Lacunisphaera sp.]